MFLEATALCFGFITDVARNLHLAGIESLSNIAVMIRTYSYAVLSLIPIAQGIAMLCLVPYFRTEVRRRVRKLNTVDGSDIQVPTTTF